MLQTERHYVEKVFPSHVLINKFLNSNQIIKLFLTLELNLPFFFKSGELLSPLEAGIVPIL